MAAAKHLLICLDNADYEVSLERLKIYIALPDAKAERTGYLRIVDESGQDYLYPSRRFIVAELPLSARRATSPEVRRAVIPPVATLATRPKSHPDTVER
jgi:hypothetical protein